MAKERTLYTRTYTYSGQISWTRASRTASWSQFKVSGDTDKEIVDIVSIEYIHYNNSHTYTTYDLKGALYLTDGTTIYSDVASQKHSPNKAYLYTNTFVDLPTPTQFGMISAVRTYAYDVDEAENLGFSGGTGCQITWRADSKYPMRIVISFYNEEPYLYDPVIEQFSVTRASRNASGSYIADDAGIYARITVAGSDLGVSTSYASTAITATNGITTKTYSNPITRAQIVSGISNYVFTTDTFSADYDWRFTLTFTYTDTSQSPSYIETTSRTATMSNSMVALHISSAKRGGVAIGDLSTATDSNPLFEVHHPSHFKRASYFEDPVFLQDGISQIKSGAAFQYGVLSAPTTVPDSSPNTATQAITFSPVFTDVPCLFVTPICSKSKLFYVVTEITKTGATVKFFNDGSGDYSATLQWLAIGGTGNTTSEGGGSDSGDDDGDDTGGGDSGGTSSTVTASANYSTGLNLATITIDGAATQIYAPTASATSSTSQSALVTGYLMSQFLKSLSFSGGTLTGTLGNGGTSTASIYSYGTSLPETGTPGQLFFLI